MEFVVEVCKFWQIGEKKVKKKKDVFKTKENIFEENQLQKLLTKSREKISRK